MGVSKSRVFEDAFNMFAGRKLGSGVNRDVFECKLRPELVVKVEIVPENGYRSFCNVLETRFWDDHQYRKAIADWLAPIHYTSPDGLVVLQERVRICDKDDVEKMPATIPAFLTDRKVQNFGWTKAGKLVCVDYAFTIPNPSVRKNKAEWWW